jgi:sugar/nucleoside kinase (ribokinase family)
LGTNVRLRRNVGDDLLGKIIIEFLRNRDTRLTEFITPQPGQASSYTIALSPERADRTFLHCTGTNAQFGVGDINFSVVDTARLFHLGYPPLLPGLVINDGEPLRAIYQSVKQLDVVTSLDMTRPDPNGATGHVNWQALLKKTLPYTDIFLPSIEEILFMLRREDYENWQSNILSHMTRDYLMTIADELIFMGSRIVGFKLGELGMYLRTAQDGLPEGWCGVEIWQPAFRVKVAGTTGAGDAAYAGFLSAWLRGLEPHDCLRWACAVGACCVEAADATSGIRDWDATVSRISAGWATRDEHPDGC